MTDASNDSLVRLGGTVTLPGDKAVHKASLLFDREAGAVSVKFDEPVAGSDTWEGSSVVIKRRLKYHEVVFNTVDLPVEDLDLVWKMNVALNARMARGRRPMPPERQEDQGRARLHVLRARRSPRRGRQLPDAASQPPLQDDGAWRLPRSSLKITDIRTFHCSDGVRNNIFLQVHTDEGIAGVWRAVHRRPGRGRHRPGRVHQALVRGPGPVADRVAA